MTHPGGRPSTYSEKITAQTYFVYVLKDIDGGVRYVGVTKSPKKRLAQHLREYKGKCTYRANWIKSVVDSGSKPVMEIVEETSDWDEAERRWVAKCRAQGCVLVNGNDGGRTMHQARSKSESHPNIKRCYRVMESNIRSLSNTGRNVDDLRKKLERFRQIVSDARANGILSDLNSRLGRLYG